jgi:hypothetical protein
MYHSFENRVIPSKNADITINDTIEIKNSMASYIFITLFTTVAFVFMIVALFTQANEFNIFAFVFAIFFGILAYYSIKNLLNEKIQIKLNSEGIYLPDGSFLLWGQIIQVVVTREMIRINRQWQERYYLNIEIDYPKILSDENVEKSFLINNYNHSPKKIADYVNFFWSNRKEA